MVVVDRPVVAGRQGLSDEVLVGVEPRVVLQADLDDQSPLALLGGDGREVARIGARQVNVARNRRIRLPVASPPPARLDALAEDRVQVPLTGSVIESSHFLISSEKSLSFSAANAIAIAGIARQAAIP
ncbi:MAG: hypothetical protein EBR52_06860 [Microbacteriaceae bacterium]|nr:hypothetical protein [Microbacteriaceae bacterium]